MTTTHYIIQNNNKIVIGTNSTDRVYIEDTGNIGISESNPLYNLDINGKVQNKYSMTKKIYFNKHAWDLNGTNLYTNDNVGIGVTNPSAKLEVGGNIYPSTTETYDLGTTDNRWRDLYLSGSSINLGGLDMSYDGSNLNISGGLNTTSNTDVKNFSINSGTQIIKMACGKYDFGGGSSGVNTATISFGTTFSNANNVRVIVRANNQPGTNYGDTFVVTTKSITTTQFTINLYRVDVSGNGWGQSEDIHWFAFETN
jgi:hypothetical protein